MSMSSKNSQHCYGAPTQLSLRMMKKGVPVGGDVICLVIATKLVVVTVSTSQLDYAKYRGQVYVIGVPSFLSFIACMTSLPPPSPMKLPSKFISSKTGLLSTHLQERRYTYIRQMKVASPLVNIWVLELILAYIMLLAHMLKQLNDALFLTSH